MAGYIRGITISFGADTSQLNGALKKTQGTLNKTQAELKQINRALKFNPGNTTLLRQKFELLQQSVTETRTKLKQLKDMQKSMDAAGVDKTSAQYRQLEREIVKTESQLKQAEGALKRFGSVGKQQALAVGQAFKTAGNKIKSAGRTITTTMSVYGVAGVYAGARLIEMSEKQAQAEQKLQEIYKSRMGVGKQAVASTLALASAQQKAGVVGDEVQLAAAQQLATYAKYPSTVNTMLPALNNLLVQQKGLNGTQEDATALANLFGKAMMGQTGALKRAGISFTEAQEQVLKYGTEEEKASMIAEVVRQNVGNMNAEFAKTDAGKIQQAKNTLGDMGEEIGAVLLPAVADLATWIGEHLLPKIQSLIDWLGQHPKIATFALALAGITAVAGPLIMIIGGIVSAIGTLITFAPILAGAFGAISAPVLAVVAAIAAAIAIGVALYKNWDTIKAKALQVFKIIATTVKVNFMTLKNAVTTIWNGIKTAITKPIETAKSVVQKAINKIKGFFPLKVGKIFSGMKLPHFSIKGSPPFGIGGKGTKPSISVNWYKKAMQNPYLFSNATLFGAGEAGDEMLYGRNSLMNDIANATGGGEVVSRLAAIEAILDYYLPKEQQIVMDNGVLIGQVNRGLGMRL
jgi:phage-related minor tail protein